jgi:hypothetical protein
MHVQKNKITGPNWFFDVLDVCIESCSRKKHTIDSKLQKRRFTYHGELMYVKRALLLGYETRKWFFISNI